MNINECYQAINMLKGGFIVIYLCLGRLESLHYCLLHRHYISVCYVAMVSQTLLLDIDLVFHM